MSAALTWRFERGGGFAAEDWELYLRLAEIGPFASAGRPLARYRVHRESKTLADRLPHTLGLIHLRRRIEARKAHWLATRDTPALRRALARHTHEFAHVWGRLGLIYQQRGEPCLARDAFQRGDAPGAARAQAPSALPANAGRRVRPTLAAPRGAARS